MPNAANTTTDKIAITKVTPVTDSVGLSTNYYGLTLNNNLTEKVYFRVTIKDDYEEIINDKCEEYLISKEDIRISVKSGKKENKIKHLFSIYIGLNPFSSIILSLISTRCFL